MATTQPQTQRKGRIGTLETARFLFIVFIYLSHCITETDRSPFDFGGESGVAFFFVLSGFVLSLGYGRKVEEGTFGVRRFFVTHLARLYPLHLLTMAATIVLDSRLGVSYSCMQILSHVFLVQTWTASVHYISIANGVAWFLCDTLFFYAVFAVVYRWLMRQSVRRLCVMGMALVAVYVPLALQVPDEKVNWTLYGYPLLRVIDFSLGILLCRFYLSQRSQRIVTRMESLSVWRATGVEMLGVAAVVVAWMLYGDMPKSLRCAALFWPVMPFVIYVLAVADGGRGLLSRLMRQPLLMRLGGVSFEIYLIHLIMMRVAYHALHTVCGETGEVQVFIVAFLASIVVAFALQRWLVTPVYNRVKSACK